MDAVASDEFQDWEVIHSSSDSESTPLYSFDEIELGGLLQENYFVEDPPNRVDEDPDRYLPKASAELLSDSSSSERSMDGDNEMGMNLCDNNERKEADFDKYSGEEESLGSSCSEIEVGSAKVSAFAENFDDASEVTVEEDGREEDKNHAVDCPSENDKKSDGEVERRRVIVRWMMPMDFLKYCLFKKTSPMWTVPAAAAMVGLVIILARRLNRMRSKAKGLQQIKVTCNDKKASEVMSRAARMNEAFSIVKRVPVIRPPLPSSVGTSTATWPVMSLR